LWLIRQCCGTADDLKLVLSKRDLFTTLLAVMERYEKNADGDRTTLMNLMADLIVLLLTGGEKPSIEHNHLFLGILTLKKDDNVMPNVFVITPALDILFS